MVPPHIQVFSEKSLLLQFDGKSMLDANANVQTWLAFAKIYWQSMLTDIVPAYDSIMLICNSPGHLLELQKLITQTQIQAPEKLMAKERITIPICYDMALGNDLEMMSEKFGLTVAEIIEIHLQKSYQVFMIGFLPGFAYLGEVDGRIVAPRKAEPVPTRKGAVGIAGSQTGIYPMDSPGGWHIVGYTPLKMFDEKKAQPALLSPGDLVRFEQIDLEKYGELVSH